MRYKASAVVAAVALALVGYNGISQPQASEIKLAYIDSDEVKRQTPAIAEAEATFEREVARWQSELQVLEDSLRQMITTFDQQQVMLSPQARAERQQEIDQKQAEWQQRVLDLRQVAQRRQQELVQPIYEMITDVLREVRDDNGYTMIFDQASGALIAADTTLDITDVVIERLQAREASPGGGS